MESRPLYRPDIRWTAGDQAVPPLDRGRLLALADAAATAAASAAQLTLEGDEEEVARVALAGARAAGVAEALYWLVGGPPGPILSRILGPEGVA